MVICHSISSHCFKEEFAMIDLKDVSVEFNQKNESVKALENISLEIEQGEWVTVLGPSGSGKTTLLNVISGMAPLNKGNVLYKDDEIYQHSHRDRQKFRRENIGYVFQDFRLFEQYTVLENVILPQIPYTSKKQLESQAKERLEQLNMSHRLNAFPSELSGGEKQRTALTRALLHEPELLLCDEPTGNLDLENRDNILHILKDFNEQGITIVLVTHDLEVAKAGHREIYLRDGKIVGSEKNA